MTDQPTLSFVRTDLVPERPAPIKTTGFVGFLRTRLFNTPTNALLTIVGVLLLWFIIVPTIQFLLVDAVWEGKDRTACLARDAGHPVGACWPFVQAENHAVHLRLLSRARTLAGEFDVPAGRCFVAAASDSAIACQKPQRRPVLCRFSRRGVFPAAWRGHQWVRCELDRRISVRLC